MRFMIGAFIFGLLLAGCGVTHTSNGWSAGVGACGTGWHVGQCSTPVK